VFECVINISEGRDEALLSQFSSAAGASLRDRHSDAFHHRSVFTLINEREALVGDARTLVGAVYERLDLTRHRGVHPRFGVVDVVPFVALEPGRADEAVALRDRTANWIAVTFDVPVFLYGPLADGSARTLPEVRRGAFADLRPDLGPDEPSPSRGSVAVGARPILVAWNLWLGAVSVAQARAIASALRRPGVRALAFEVGSDVQVSCNITDTDAARPSQLYDQAASMLPAGGLIRRAELVGLAPRSLVNREDHARWVQLALSPDSTIEARCGL
jgi:glutamate formiminotransferase